MPRFIDLEPRFIVYDPNEPLSYKETEHMTVAHGVIFLCPFCAKDKIPGHPEHGRTGHSILCWTSKVPPTVAPLPGRWNWTGDRNHICFHGATPDGKPASDSVLLLEGCKAHFFVENGMVKIC